jgi:hypothetical protein
VNKKMNECNENGCATGNYKDCGCQSDESCSTCSDSSSDSCGSSDMMMAMWHKAAMQAMIEIKKDAIKTKLQAKFGEAADKGADAVIEAMGAKMQASIQQEQAMGNLKNKLASILAEAIKKN